LSFWDDKDLVQSPATDQELLQAIGRISTFSSEARYVWRGQPDLDWGLNPGLVRRLHIHNGSHWPVTEAQLLGHEALLLESAKAAGYDQIYGRTINEVELLAVLQHQGAATRLLDVSSDPMVAMWFAVENQSLPKKTDGALFAINISNAEVISGTESKPWAEILRSMKPRVIGFYEPPWADERIKVQRGRFIFSRLTGEEESELSLPIKIGSWNKARRDQFFNQARRSGRPKPPSILVLKIPWQIKVRLLGLLENSYGYTSETMFPDLSGFSTANSWQRPLRPGRRPVVPLEEKYLPVAVNLRRIKRIFGREAQVKDLSRLELLEVARRELSISSKKIDRWLEDPTCAPQYWVVYHADEIVGVFEIDEGSWRQSAPKRYICNLSVTTDPGALAILGHSFVHEGELLDVEGRGMYVSHTEPNV
jgi:hypothetical protein